MAAASVLAQLWAASTTENSEEAFRVAYTSEESTVNTVSTVTQQEPDPPWRMTARMSLCAGWRGQRKAVLQLAWILLLKVTSVSRPVSWDSTCRGTLIVATCLYPGPTCRSSSSLRPNLPPEQRDTASLATRSLRVVAGPARAGEVDDCKY